MYIWGWEKETSNPKNTTTISSPTITTESLLLTCLIDAMEDLNVAIVNILDDFMQADI